MKIKEFTGKTTKEAIDNGLAELGVTIADVHVDVLQEGAKGLFGLFGSKPACVRLTVMDDEREDLGSYVNLFGYNPKYGVSGRRIVGVRYEPQSFSKGLTRPEQTFPARVARR